MGLAKQAGQAAAIADEASLAMKVAMEGGNIAGSSGLTTIVTGENQFTPEALLQAAFMNQLGKIRSPGHGATPGAGAGAPAHPAGEAPVPAEGGAPARAPEPAGVRAEGEPGMPAPGRPVSVPEPAAPAPAPERPVPSAEPAAPAAPAATAQGPAAAAAPRPEAGPARSEARALANSMEVLGSRWTGMNGGERLRGMEPIVNAVLAPRDVPPARVSSGEVNVANGADAAGDRAGREAQVMEAERQAGLADIAADQVRRWVRDVEGRLLDEVAAGREPDPRLVAEHDRALERLRGLEDRADDLAARRDAMIDETGAAPPDPAIAAPPVPAAAQGGSPARPGPPSTPKASRRPGDEPAAPPARGSATGSPRPWTGTACRRGSSPIAR